MLDPWNLIGWVVLALIVSWLILAVLRPVIGFIAGLFTPARAGQVWIAPIARGDVRVLLVSNEGAVTYRAEVDGLASDAQVASPEDWRAMKLGCLMRLRSR